MWPVAAVPAASPEPEELFTIESGLRLSQSRIWQAQRRFFEQQGIAAWSESTVPHYATNNPAHASACARAVFGYLRDWHRAIEPGQPVYILELGAGSGRFSFLFLKALEELCRSVPLGGLSFVHVMTDFGEANLSFWREHPALAPFLERGLLDFAIFDAEHGAELHLRRTGATLSPGGLANPLVVLANYVFDGIPFDAFSLRGGQLHEGLVSVASPTPGGGLDGAQPFADLALRFEQRPAAGDYYSEPDLDAILEEYTRDLTDATIFFPCTAIRAVRRLAALSSGRMFLLSADRDDGPAAFGRAPDETGLAIHGSISFPVNHDAMGRHVVRAGGSVLAAPFEHAHLRTVGFLLGEHPADHPETRLAFDHAMTRAGPDDFFQLRMWIQHHYDSLDLGQLLAMLRTSHHDPRILVDCLPALTSLAATAAATTRADVVRTVLRVWDNFYSIGEEADLAFHLGVFLYGIGAPADALRLFQASLDGRGGSAATLWNMGLCHFASGEAESAERSFAAARALDPALRPPPLLEHGAGR